MALLLILLPQIYLLHIGVAIGEHDPLHSLAQHLLAPLLLDQHPHDTIQDFISHLCLHLSLLPVLPIGVDENGPLQRVSGEMPPAQPCTPFLARIAVAMPVALFRNLDCLGSSHGDAPGAGDEGVGELFQGPHLVLLQRLTVLQLVVAVLQHVLVDPFHLDLVEIQPQDAVNVSSSSPLELDTVADVAHLHGVVAPKDDLLPEGFHAMLEVAGGEEDISSHHGVQFFVHVVFEVLLPGLFDGLLAILHLHRHILLARLIHIVVHCAVLLLQLWGEVGAPPHVATGEGEEDLEAVDQNIVNFDKNLIK